ncbi:sigma-54-dependent transcriptional regulator [Daejeonella oryzae]|uniref:sigma-54-dependent transcriptional regulator n=1 Tax=Daejeonella oryzae TaxID=1122943 RepID=UPI000402AFD7|nr:sigma-54 dependent transcriptional regulator [Daejeonella oryzae]
MTQPSILIVDDENKLRQLLGRILQLEGYRVWEAENVKEAWRILEREEITLVLSDVKLPDGNGVELAAQIKLKFPALEIIVLTAFGSIEDGVKAIKNGAFDYIIKGDDNDKIIPLVSKAINKSILQHKIFRLENKLRRQFSFENIVGNSAEIKAAINISRRVAVTDTTVLLLGETGTGKEVFAQAIHQESQRQSRSFVAVNCSSFLREILESELFGYKAGAFTGALKDKKGLWEEAEGGTIFLDEIAEMSMDLQAKLLRVLENGEYIKLGDTKTMKSDVRIIAATNRDLSQEIEKGTFRSDLYYRLSVFAIKLPALRERAEDISLLAEHYLREFSHKTNRQITGMDKEFLIKISRYSWKGNVRELKNTIERAVILSDSNTLTPDLLPIEFHINSDSLNRMDLASVEQAHIQKVLYYSKGNKAEAARLLNIGLTTLYRKIEEYQLDTGV